ncbi:unnamed protein product [Durusdinium trenchii]|uniref:S1 motif domain-containing protein n=1 Tax=Durusdinium trenchii TaxID=1381693 RepID=A0ABP0IGL3_9DINO
MATPLGASAPLGAPAPLLWSSGPQPHHGRPVLPRWSNHLNGPATLVLTTVATRATCGVRGAARRARKKAASDLPEPPPLPDLPPLPKRTSAKAKASEAEESPDVPPLPPLPSFAIRDDSEEQQPSAAEELPELPPLNLQSDEELELDNEEQKNRKEAERREKLRFLGPTARAWALDPARPVPREFYMLQRKDEGKDEEPRPLAWEEARIDFLPLGETVRGVVEEIRPYGSFIGLVMCGMEEHGGPSLQRPLRFGEDSGIRCFCEELQVSNDRAQLQVGEQVAVKILQVDQQTKRVFGSIRQAEPPWPPPREPVLHSPEKYEDENFKPC